MNRLSEKGAFIEKQPQFPRFPFKARMIIAIIKIINKKEKKAEISLDRTLEISKNPNTSSTNGTENAKYLAIVGGNMS